MKHFLNDHENYVKEALKDPETDLGRLLSYHKTWIEFMQHERMSHLIVTVTVAIVLIITFGISIFSQNPLFLILDIILMILLTFYIMHYYQLENGVQRWYALFNEIVEKDRIKGGDHV